MNTALYRVRHLARLPLGMPYPAQIAAIGKIYRQLPSGSELLLDYTGVGRGIADMFEDAGYSPIKVTITAGESANQVSANLVSVPKSLLISRLVALMHSGQLRVHRALAEWPVLRLELQNFRPEMTASGARTWNAAAGHHDDLLIAVALAGWRLMGREMASYGIFQRYQEMSMATGLTMPPEKACLAVDLGQAKDPSAICLMTRVEMPIPDDVRDYVR